MYGPFDLIFPLFIDTYTSEQQLYFLLGYEYNSIVATMLDRSVSVSECPAHLENLPRIVKAAEKCGRVVTWSYGPDNLVTVRIERNNLEKA